MGLRVQRTDLVLENSRMLRTIFMIGLFAIAGLFVLKFFFGILPGILGLIAWLFFVAVKIALVGGAIYLTIRIFSPDTARRLREKWSGNGV
jgi:hypothetical protein